MKLDEILDRDEKADGKLRSWVRKNINEGHYFGKLRKGWITAWDGQIRYNDAATNMTGPSMTLYFEPKSGISTWDPPINDPDHAFEYVKSIMATNYVFQDLKKIASSTLERVFFFDSEIQSYDGIEGFTNLKSISVYEETLKRSKPLQALRLLKLPKLELIELSHIPSDAKWKKLIQIINSHLKTKDIADCMDDLISAGFKEYAKL
jgi:hypothetical protein